MVADAVTIREFLKAFRKFIWLNAFTKLSKDSPFMVNSQENGLLIISRFCLRELMTTMINGNIYAMKMMISLVMASASATFFLVPPIDVWFIMLPPPVFSSYIPGFR